MVGQSTRSGVSMGNLGAGRASTPVGRPTLMNTSTWSRRQHGRTSTWADGNMMTFDRPGSRWMGGSVEPVSYRNASHSNHEIVAMDDLVHGANRMVSVVRAMAGYAFHIALAYARTIA